MWRDSGSSHPFSVNATEPSYILGATIPEVPYLVAQWRREHPDTEIPDEQSFTQPWPATDKQKAQGRRDKVTYYQYKADRARRALRGIDEQVAKAEKAVAGKIPVKRNRFIQLAGGQKSVNRDLEAKARALAGLKGYITNIADPAPGFVIGAYHRLFQIEKSFRMAIHAPNPAADYDNRTSTPAPHKPPRSGNSATRSGLVSKPRSTRRPPPQAFAAAATTACPKRT